MSTASWSTFEVTLEYSATTVTGATAYMTKLQSTLRVPSKVLAVATAVLCHMQPRWPGQEESGCVTKCI